MGSPTTPLLFAPGATASRLVPQTIVHVAPGSANGNTAVTASAAGDLPVILAGPILRRVDARRVFVWLALSAACTVTLTVLDPHGAPGGPRASFTTLATGLGAPVTLGPRLHLVLCSATAAADLPLGQILAYDLTFQAPTGFEFSDESGLVARDDLTYGGAPLPTFTRGLPPESRRLNIFHASCRKLHAAGEDAMHAVNRKLGATWSNPQERASAFLHTGDQIYADDVEPRLLAALTAASDLVLGWQELAPDLDQRTAELHPGLRADPIRSTGHFTVDADVAGSHLFGFGEFCAMYLFAWSPAIWSVPALHRALAGFQVASPTSARRALANVPNYMIWDDHEVTDDWPMTRSMRDAVTRSPLGSWVVANGMAACWFFQLWGNGAGQSAGFLDPLREYLEAGRNLPPRSPTLDDPSTVGRNPYAQTIEAFQDGPVHRYAAAVLATRGMGFIAPTTLPVVFLDTRTQRELSEGPPGLMNAPALGQLKAQIRSITATPLTPLLVVSAAPVFGFVPLESIQEMSAMGSVSYSNDTEAWAFNGAAFHSFLQAFEEVGRRRVILLSGDVHFGFVVDVTYRSQGAATETRFLQLTSSALCNPPTGNSGRGLDVIDQVRNGPSTMYLGQVHSPLYTRTMYRDEAFENGARSQVVSTPLARLDLSYTGVQAGSRVFDTNNFGVVRVTWDSSEVIHVTQQLVGASAGMEATVTLPLHPAAAVSHPTR